MQDVLLPPALARLCNQPRHLAIRMAQLSHTSDTVCLTFDISTSDRRLASVVEDYRRLASVVEGYRLPVQTTREPHCSLQLW